MNFLRPPRSLPKVPQRLSLNPLRHPVSQRDDFEKWELMKAAGACSPNTSDKRLQKNSGYCPYHVDVVIMLCKVCLSGWMVQTQGDTVCLIDQWQTGDVFLQFCFKNTNTLNTKLHKTFYTSSSVVQSNVKSKMRRWVTSCDVYNHEDIKKVCIRDIMEMCFIVSNKQYHRCHTVP